MAREYARVKVSIWADLDFRALTPDAQHLYFLLLTAPKLNLVGVSDWRPNRIAAKAKGWNVRKVRAAGQELESARFVVIDEETEEVLIRSFVRHDGVLKGPKTAIGLANDFGSLSSQKIMRSVAMEVARAATEDPSMKGLNSVGSVLQFASDTQADTQSGDYPSTIPIPQPTTNNQQPSETAPSGADRFAEFYLAYPKKVGKPAAEKAWRAAVKKTQVEQILAGLEAHLPKWAASDPQFIPNPATWLNQERWADEVQPQKRAGNDDYWSNW